jgi:hypothetical protein
VDGEDGSAVEGITRRRGVSLQQRMTLADDDDDVDGCVPCLCEALGWAAA